MVKSVLILMILLFPSISYADGIILDSITEAQVLSDELDKPLLLIFGADYCEYCKKLKLDINNNKQPIDNYIICYIDIEKNKDIQYKDIKTIPESRIIINKKIVSTNYGYNNSKYSLWLKKYNDL